MAKLDKYNKESKKLSNVSYFTCVDVNGTVVNIPITQISNITASNDAQIAILLNRTQHNTESGTVSVDYVIVDNDVDYDSNSLLNEVGLGFANGQQITWNSTFKTIDIPTGVGPVLQVGQEIYFILYNNTGSLVPNGTVVKPTGATVVSGEVESTLASGIIDLSDGRTFHRTIGTATSFELQNEEVCDFKIFMAATGAVSVATEMFTHSTKTVTIISKYDTINSSYALVIDCSILFVDGSNIYVAYEIKQQ